MLVLDHTTFRLLAIHADFKADETFAAGSGMLSISISLNTLSDHGLCTAAFVAIAAGLAFGLGSIRTLGKVTWLAWAGLAFILTASKSS